MNATSSNRASNAVSCRRPPSLHIREAFLSSLILRRTLLRAAAHINRAISACTIAGGCALLLAACGAAARPPSRTTGAVAARAQSHHRAPRAASRARLAPTPAATIPCPGDPLLTVNRFTSCPFARNVLDAFTTSPTGEMPLAAAPVLGPRTVTAPSPVTGRTYRMRCALNARNGAEGNGPVTVTCTGGDRAETLFPLRFTGPVVSSANAVAADPYCQDWYCGYNRPWFQACQPGYRPRTRTFCLAGPAAVRRMAAPADKHCGAGVIAGSGVLCGFALEEMSEYSIDTGNDGRPDPATGCALASPHEVRCDAGGVITFPWPQP